MEKTTNTARAARVMARAHTIARRITAAHPGDCYRVNLAAALRLAWEEDGRSPREIFESWPENERYDYLMRMTGHEYRIDDARTIIKNGQRVPAAPVFTWVCPARLADDLAAVAHEAYIRLYTAYFDNPDKQHMSLARMTSRAIVAAAKAIREAEKRNASALRHTVTEEGQELDVIDISARGTAEPIAPGPEAAAIIRDSITRACRDDIDLRIVAALGAGYSARRIAPAVNLSRQAVDKRIKAIRERYAAAK